MAKPPHPANPPANPPERPLRLRWPEQDDTEAHARWEALLDAGLIGQRTETPPEVAANRDRWDALFRGSARSRPR